jgi:hypothetical protein
MNPAAFKDAPSCASLADMSDPAKGTVFAWGRREIGIRYGLPSMTSCV